MLDFSLSLTVGVRMSQPIVLGLNAVWQKIHDLKELLPGEVMRDTRVECYASGKGANVAVALERLGASPICLVQCIGGIHGELVRKDLTRFKIEQYNILIQQDTRCCHTLRETQGRVSELIEPSPKMSELEWQKVNEVIKNFLSQGAAIFMVSGSLPEGYDEVIFESLKQRDSRSQLWIDSVDTRWLSCHPEVVKINKPEACGISKCENIQDAGRALIKEYSLKNLIITNQCEAGYASCEGQEFTFSVPKAPVVRNTIGAGDSFFGGLCFAKIQNLPWSQALDFASHFASLRCQFNRIEDIPYYWRLT
jgi:1-phosphofructokinase